MAWFEWYRVAAGDKSVAAHMKSVAFADGEELTQVRGERNWIAVSGFHGDRIFYRQALLACAGDRWHQIAFEYPSNAKGSIHANDFHVALLNVAANRSSSVVRDRLGRWLWKVEGRIVSGLMLKCTGTLNGYPSWVLLPM
jgi:hypothetical protein